jgi:hypothetical protein
MKEEEWRKRRAAGDHVPPVSCSQHAAGASTAAKTRPPAARQAAGFSATKIRRWHRRCRLDWLDGVAGCSVLHPDRDHVIDLDDNRL